MPLLAFVTVLFPQNVSFMPRFVAGDEFGLEVRHTRSDSRQAAANFSATTPIAVRVVSVSPAGTVLDWTPGEVTVTGGAELSDPALQMAAEIVDDVTIRVALDPDGSFGSIANAKELLSKLQAVLEVVMTDLEKGKPAADAAKVRAMMAQILTPQNLLNMATREIQSYVSMHGVEIPATKALDIPIRQPNPFGGEPLSAVMRLRVEPGSASSVALLSETVFDTDALKKSTIAMLEQAAPAGKKPTAEELASFRIDLSDDGRYVFDPALGLFRQVTVTRKTVTTAGEAKATRSDRYDIRMITPPKR